MIMSRGGCGGCLSGLALLAAGAALFVSWTAYRRTGGDLDQLLGRGGKPLAEAQKTLDTGSWEAGRQAYLAQAKVRLLAQRAEIAANRNLDQARREVEDIRSQLNRAFKGAGAEARARWGTLDDDLARLEAQLREGSAKAVSSLDEALAKLRGEK